MEMSRRSVSTVCICSLVLLGSFATATLARLTFDKHPAVVRTTVGKDAVLDCQAGGSPVPIIRWYHKGRLIAQGDERGEFPEEGLDNKWRLSEDEPMSLEIGKTRSRLFIDCVSHRDAGEYTCVAATPEKTISTVTTLDVGHAQEPKPHSCISKRLSQGKPARIYMWTVSRLDLEGSTAQLFCRADGYPRPTVQWYDKDGELITNNHRYHILKNGDLVIKNIKWVDNMGNYKCVAENPRGTDSVTIFLYPTTWD